MATIVTRQEGATAKGSPLTNAELDNNFININTELGQKAPLGGAGASGTWGINISGNAASSTYVGSQDIRTLSPSSTSVSRLGFGFTSWANNNTSAWADYLALRSYSDASGGNDNLLMFNKSVTAMRLWSQSWGSSAAYSSYADVLMSNNYNSYSPTLTGTGASGTWGINITGTSRGVGTSDPGIGTGGLWVTYGSGLNVARNNTAYIVLDAANYTTYALSTVNSNTITYNSGITGTSAPGYTSVGLQIYTTGNNVPALSFHRGNYSATTLYEYDGELYTNPWTTRSQTGKLLAAGNYSSYALPLSGGTITGTFATNIGGDAASSTKHISLTNGSSYELNLLPRVGSGSYNPLVQNGDSLIVWQAGAVDTGALSIAPWSTVSVGLRIARLGAITLNSYYGSSSLQDDVGFVINGNYTDGRYSHRFRKWDDGNGVPLYLQSTYGVAGTWSNIAKFGPSGSDESTLTVYGPIKSVSSLVQGNNLARPLSEWGVGGSSTGMVYIEFPGGSANYGMIHAVIDVYEYNNNAGSTITVSGHNWSGGWYNISCQVVGTTNKSVRLGFRNGKYVICLGTASSTWEYGTVILRKIHNGVFYNNIINMSSGFNIAQTTSENLSWDSGDIRQQVLSSTNYNSYSPTLSGTGASGTWPINVTGAAGSILNNNIVDYLRITNNGGPQKLLMGNQDSAGINNPTMIVAANGSLQFGNGNSWTTDGGTFTPYATLNSSYANFTTALQQSSNQVLHAGNYQVYALPLSGGTLTGQLYIRNTSPTIYLRDTDHRSAMLHVNSNEFYILRGSGTDSDGWTQVNGYWPFRISLETNDATFGGSLTVATNLTLSPSNPYIYSGGSYIIIPNGLYVSGGTTYLEGPLRARNVISNDTGSVLYLDGGNTAAKITETTGLLRTVKGIADQTGTNNPLRLVNPGGAANWVGTSSVQGAIKIRLPNTGPNTMLRFTVKVYTYDGQSFDVTCGGYPYFGPNWYNTFAFMNGQDRDDLYVRFGHDGTYYCVMIGEVGTVWAYPSVFVTDFQGGYSNYSAVDWNQNWDISFVTSLPTVNVTKLAGRPLYSNGTISGNAYFGSNFLKIATDNSAPASGNYFRGGSSHLVIGTGGTLYLNYGNTSGQTYIYGSTNLSTAYGTLDIGPLNSTYCHFQTDRSAFYFNKDTHIHGTLYNYGNGATYLHSTNYSNYALPLSGGTLTGTIKINTSSSGSSTSHVIIKRSGAAEPASFGSYSGSWRSSIEIWDNDSAKMLFLNPPNDSSLYSNIKSVGGGFFIDVGSGGATRAIQIESNGVVNFPQSGLSINSNTALHAGNYTQYSSILRALGSNDGMDFNTLTYNSMYSAYIENSPNKPSSYSYQYGVVLTFDPNTGSNGRAQMYISHAGNDLCFRGGWTNNDSWQAWNRVLTNNNYTSYSPTLTGSGASGTWGISITGNSATVAGLSVHTDRNNESNKIVRTDGNGYIQAGWINTISGDLGRTLPDKIFLSHDGYIRYASLNTAKSHLGLTAKYGDSRANITSDTNYWTGTMGWGTNDWNAVANWGSGFVDSWSSPSNRPDDGGGHHVGIQTFHYTDGTTRYGWQMVNGSSTDRFWLRYTWGSSFSGWREILHSNNYSSYSPSLTGSGASGTWGINITGSSGSVSGLTLTSSAGAINPDSVTQNQLGYTSGVSLFGQSDGGLYSSAYSSAWIHEIYGDFRTGQIAIRGKNSGTWQSWRTVLDSSNYTAYAPSLTGSGASGRWNIAPANGVISNLNSAWTGPGSSIDNGLFVYRYDDSASNKPGSVDNANWLLNIYGHPSGGTASYGHQMTGQDDGSLYYRNVANGSFGSWNKIIHSNNYNSYAPSLTGAGASGTWGINISGSAAQLNGYSSAENGNSVILRTASNGYLYLYNWINVATAGLYSSTNSAHFYPNNLSYGSWRIEGSRNGWAGLAFSSTSNGVINLMVNPSSNHSGLYNESYGWQTYWSGGNLYCGKNTYGGGTEAIVLDAVNYSNYALPLSGGTVTGVSYFRSNAGSGVYSGSTNSPPLQAYSNDSGSAFMSFHRGGYYAVNMGLDPDNVLRIGGWSASSNRFQMDMSGNLTMAGNVTASSDERLKKDWIVLPKDFVEKLALVKSGTFTRIDEDMRQVGVSAQSLQSILPEAVLTNSDGNLSVAYGNAALSSAVELAKEVVSLKEELKQLKSLINSLINKV